MYIWMDASMPAFDKQKTVLDGQGTGRHVFLCSSGGLRPLRQGM